MTPQPAILAPSAPVVRFLTFRLEAFGSRGAANMAIASLKPDDRIVLGIGEPLTHAMVAGLTTFPALAHGDLWVPSSQGALWCAIGGSDAGETLHLARKIVHHFEQKLILEEDICGFVFAGGRDLTGFVDGTENPKGEAAVQAAISGDTGKAMAGSSFVAVQRWVHKLNVFEKQTSEQHRLWVGRDMTTNEELPEAPKSAHVKRAAQESFEPPAFILRKSMPYGDLKEHGLYFAAYGATLRPFETILRRMIGLEDGIVDSLFKFTRPVTGGYYWCPAIDGDRYVLP